MIVLCAYRLEAGNPSAIACYLKLSMCYERSMHNQPIVVVVSPLIALMKDQVRAMAQRNVTAVYTCETDVTASLEHMI